MKTLTDEQLAYLNRFGFDHQRFETWRKGVHEGWLSLDKNKLAAEILAPPTDAVKDLPKRGTPEADELEAIGRAAVRNGEVCIVVLNGGMATRFGGVVKGVVEVLPGRSFLGLKLQDVKRVQDECGGRVPVYLMNSFATDEDTGKHLLEQAYFGLDPDQVTMFTQFISVRMDPDGDIFTTDEGNVSPHGPGHGDFAPAFRDGGCLASFREGGGQHVFVANVDNLGARLSPLLIGHHIQSGKPATVEVAPKWPGDVGGAPYLYDGRVQLIEQIRFPEGFDPDIVDVFNTNTFHFRADALDRDFDFGWYFVEKKVEGRPAVQIERLIGEMTRFLDSNFIRVKRTGQESRFFPIKTPDDLDAGREEIAEMYED